MKKLSSQPDHPLPIKAQTNGAAPIPPDMGNGRDDNFPYDIFRKSICLSNALSFAAGNCSACETPDACTNMVGDVLVFIDEMHQLKN
ncbi:MAG: hypothetical protein OEW37_07085 [Rhodospirillaceae bacterium]|nr:hypothetical protein [Rhodospirillaceae bacterium]